MKYTCRIYTVPFCLSIQPPILIHQNQFICIGNLSPVEYSTENIQQVQNKGNLHH